MKSMARCGSYCLFAVLMGTTALAFDGAAPLVRGGVDVGKLTPAEGNVTWRLAYLSHDEKDTTEKPPTKAEKTVTVPVDVVDAHGEVNVEFDDIRCVIMYGVDIAKISVYAKEGDKLLYDRLFQGNPKNVVGDGFTGENTVYHPTSGALVRISAFAGPEKGAALAKAETKLTDKPRGKLTDFTKEEIAAAKQHADYAALSNVQAIMIGQVQVKELSVLESFPPIYEYELQVTLRQVLSGSVSKGKSFTTRYSVSEGRTPKLDEGVDYLIALSKRNRSLDLLKPANDDIVDVATIAYLTRQQRSADGLQSARSAPANHPLHKALSEAAGVALIGHHLDPLGGVEFDLRTELETTTYRVVRNLKGDLKTSSTPKLSMPEDVSRKMPGIKGVYVATYRRDGGQWIVDDVHPANEETLLIVAKVFSVDVQALEKTVQENQNATRGDDDPDAVETPPSEPQQGSSTPSPGF